MTRRPPLPSRASADIREQKRVPSPGIREPDLFVPAGRPLFSFRYIDLGEAPDRDAGGPWSLDRHRLLGFLKDTSGRTLNEIYVDSKKQNHGIEKSSLSKWAQGLLQALNLDDAVDELHTLRLSARERLWVFRYDAVLYLLWYDPEHRVCPTKAR